MSGARVEDRLREIAEAGRGDGTIPLQVLVALRRRRQRRRMAAGGAVLAAAAAVTLVAVGPTVLFRSDDNSRGRPAHPAGGKVVPTQPPTAPPPVHFAPLPEAARSGEVAEPTTMLALIGAGAERLARVDTRTGAIDKWLQSKGSQLLMTFNHDRSTAYQPDLVGCGAKWTAIDTRTGATQPAFQDLGRPLEVALAGDDQRVAYVDVGPQSRVADGHGGTMPAGCPTASHDLVVTDPLAGTTARFPIASYDESLYPAFDGSGTRLAFVWHRQVRILDLNHDAALADAQPLTANPRHGCTQSKPLWRPGTDTVLVAEQCGQQSAIVGYDARTGGRNYQHHVAGPSLIGSFAVDSSGQHIAYSVSRLDSAGAGIYAVEPGGDRHIVDDAYQVTW